jgi:hypothetical protein
MLDALTRIEHQLVEAAARQQLRPVGPVSRPVAWRPPRAVLVLLILLALASAASAVTGVGPLGDLFRSEQGGLAPESGAPRVTVAQRAPSGTEVVMRAYENNEGSLCIQTPPVEELLPQTVVHGCAPPPEVARRIERDGTFAGVAETGAGTAFYGLVRGDATSLRVQGGGDPAVEAELADETIAGHRPFVAILGGPVPTATNPVQLIIDDGLPVRWPPAP